MDLIFQFRNYLSFIVTLNIENYNLSPSERSVLLIKCEYRDPLFYIFQYWDSILHLLFKHFLSQLVPFPYNKNYG